MALSLRRGRVTRVVERQAEIVRCEVDGVPCVAYPSLTGPVDEGDEVLVNVQARELGLGSGGLMRLSARSSRSQAALAWAISLSGGDTAGSAGAGSSAAERMADTDARVISASLASSA